jgi:beta-lactamase class A
LTLLSIADVHDTLTRRRFTMGLGAMITSGLVWRWPAARAIQLSASGGAIGSDLASALAQIEARSGGRLGVAVYDTETGRQVGHRAQERFPMCSTFKVIACGAVLARVDANREDLSRCVRFAASDVVPNSPVTKDRAGGDGMTLAELCAAAMTRSDNTAANMILASLGGPPGVTAYARSLGDVVTRLDRTEPTLNEATPGDDSDTTSPQAIAADLHALALSDQLSPTSRGQFTAWLTANQTGGARLRAGLPHDWCVGDKTGSGNRGTTNDVAVIWPADRAPVVVAAYLTNTAAAPDARNATIAAVAHALVTWLTA